MTSWLFPSGKFSLERLQQLSSLIGKEQLVIDLSCRRQKNSWFVAINKWQTVTSLEITKGENKEKAYKIYVGSIASTCIFLPNNHIQNVQEMSSIAENLPCRTFLASFFLAVHALQFYTSVQL